MSEQVAEDASKAMKVMATAATTLREAISTSLPVATNQLMTVQIPGTVINVEDYYYDQKVTAFKPLSVRVNEARLCDGMIPLSKIMLGGTGKSVARSYESALDLLVPVEASISGLLAGSTTEPIVDPRKKVIKERYDKSMQALKDLDTDAAGNTLPYSKLNRYIEKQEAWSNSITKYTIAQKDQQDINERLYPNDKKKQREEFLSWIQSHSRNFKAAIQARYMDWVVHGYKFNSSKEAVRNLVIISEDGYSEYNQLHLEPSNWATIVRNKILAWNTENKGPSATEIRAEIRRLRNLLISHKALRESVSSGSFMGVAPGSNQEADKKLEQAYQNAYGGIQGRIKQFADSNYTDLIKAQNEWKDQSLSSNKANIKELEGKQKEEVTTYLDAKIKDMERQIEDLEKEVSKQGNQSVSVINEAGEPVTDQETRLDPDMMKAPPGPNQADVSPDQQPSPWTKITAKVSSSSSTKSSVQSESASSFAAKAGWGWWSASASGSTTNASAEAMSQMSNLEAEVSMECLLVNVNRPWLRAELFADADLDTGPGVELSPGETELKDLVNSNGKIDAKYQQFSSYPTAFVVAANVELSFSGDVQKLESAMSSSSTNANASVGWGPFSLSASHKSSTSKSRTKTEATATGMKISMQAPQIISWVQTLLPKLPHPLEGTSRMAGLEIAQEVDPKTPATG